MLNKEVYWYCWYWYIEKHKFKHSRGSANPKQNKYKENDT